jgi:hypothetical protein
MYLIRIKENRKFAIALEHPDAIWANVEEGSYVLKKNATQFRSRTDAEKELNRQDEEIVEVSNGK